MEIIRKEIKLDKNVLELIPKDTFFFDIETLGLSPSYCAIYLIGTMDVTSGVPVITLFFANSTDDEEHLLRAFYDYAKDFKSLITFNGEAFDIPFVKKRSERYNLDFSFDGLKSTDIYRVVRRFKNMFGIEKLGQKRLEEFLGIFREDKYDGGRLIEVYKSYEITGDSELKDLLILHNFEDVEGMAPLLSLLNYCALLSGDFEITNIDCSDLTQILFTAVLENPLPRTVRALRDNFHVKAEDYMIRGALNTDFCMQKLFFKNTKDYVYLPCEDIIVPKSIASTIPNDRKQKATRENCCLSTEGYFFKLPSENKFKSCFNLSGKKIFKEDYHSETQYILVSTKKDSPDESELSELIKSMIKFLFS